MQVNAGPLTYAIAFTTDTQKRKYGEQVRQLAAAFRDLLHVCAEALHINQQLIGTNQVEYHAMLVDGYEKMNAQLAEIFAEYADFAAVSLTGAVDDADALSESATTPTMPQSHIFDNISKIQHK